LLTSITLNVIQQQTHVIYLKIAFLNFDTIPRGTVRTPAHEPWEIYFSLMMKPFYFDAGGLK
jgi:hypothetical protein